MTNLVTITSSRLFSFFANNLIFVSSPNREALSKIALLSDRRGGVRLLAERRGGCSKEEKINFIEYNRAYISYAEHNRKVSTKVEIIFRQIVKNRKFLGYKFRRQKVVGPFILDFYCSELLLGIELDGGYHNDRVDYDTYRGSEIYKKGILVVRFRNEDIEKNLSGVMSELEDIIEERKSILYP